MRTATCALLVLLATPAHAQNSFCDGHEVIVDGGRPRAALGRDGLEHVQPTIPEPPNLDRVMWDPLVFNARDRPEALPEWSDHPLGYPVEQRITMVMDRATAMSFNVCMESADETFLGERIEPMATARWWRHVVRWFANMPWRGKLQVGGCPETSPDGWVHVQTAEDGVAHTARAFSWRNRDPHGVLTRWRRSDIVFNPEVHWLDDDRTTETLLAHEVGHVPLCSDSGIRQKAAR